MSIGVPIKLIHECEGHVVTLELKSGEMYRGTLVEAEDNMNCELVNISFTVTRTFCLAPPFFSSRFFFFFCCFRAKTGTNRIWSGCLFAAPTSGL